MSDKVEIELVGGPLDGRKFRVRNPGFFVHYDHAKRKHTYGMGDDGKYHHCPEIPVENVDT